MSHPSVVWSFSKNPGAVLAAPWPTAPAAARGAAGVALAGTPPALVRPTRSAKTPQKRPPPRRLWQRLHSAWRWLRPPLLCGVHVEAPAWFGFKRIQWKVETVESENKIVKIYQNGAVSCFFCADCRSTHGPAHPNNQGFISAWLWWPFLLRGGRTPGLAQPALFVFFLIVMPQLQQGPVSTNQNSQVFKLQIFWPKILHHSPPSTLPSHCGISWQ